MPTNLDPTGRHATARGALRAARRSVAAARDRLEPARGQDGFLLVEVIVSALLVGLIVIGTFNGFDVAERFSTAERQHEQAALIAAASQEQLRSEPASILASLKLVPHTYTQTVQGTKYTVMQSAELQPAAKASGGVCNSSRQAGNAYRITSTVSWHLQEETQRPPVSSSALITPPIGSSLEVDLLTAPGATTGVSGVTVAIKYKPQGTSGTATQSQTTGSEGCVLFGAVPSLEAEVEVAELVGFVTVDGKPAVPNKTVSLAPNYTVHDTVVYNRAGAIQANFVYSGSATANHKNNLETGEVVQTVTGDTFVASNGLMEVAPNFEDGSTAYGSKVAIPWEVKTGTFQASAATKTNLFPFAEEENGYWSVYAGDCTANNPETVTGGAIKPEPKVLVKPTETTGVNVPTSYTTLNVYSKKEGAVKALAHSYEGLETTTSYPILIDNLGCFGTAPNNVVPNNETEVNYKHAQSTTTGSSIGGHLTNPFQPFGKEFTLCLSSTAKNQTYKVKYENAALAGGTINIYLEQRPSATVKAEREAKETAYKTEEAAYKTAKTKYEEKQTKYKTAETAYKAKEANKEQNKVAETKKNEYVKAKAEYEKWLNEYNKSSGSGGKKASQKTEYEHWKTEYEKFETEYKAAETKYEEWNKPHTEYETYLAEYNTYKTSYEKAFEKYETYKKEWEAAKKEEGEGTNVAVASGTTCT
jgi:Tfp pilus assembly protein PilV